MKKTQFKDAIRNIGKRKVSFLSLCLVVMLGPGALLTTRYMVAGLEKSFVDYYSEHNFKDFEMVSSLGVSEESLETIRGAEGVTAVEGIIQADGTISFGDKKRNVVVMSKSSEISVPELLEGKIPAARSECMIGEDVAEAEGLKVGDTVRISLTGLDALSDEPLLYEKEFTITGLMHHPDYLRRKSTNTVVLPLDAFNKEATDGLYTRAIIRTEIPEKVGMFSDGYFDETADTKKALEDLEDELGASRTKEMQDEAYATIDEEWAKALAKLEDGQRQIDEGEAELDSKLKSGKKQLKGAEKTLAQKVAEYKKQISTGEELIKKAETAIAEIDKALPGVKKKSAEMRESYEGDLEYNMEQIAEIEENIKELEKIEDMTSGEYGELVKETARIVDEYQSTITDIHDFFARDDVQEMAEKIRDITDGALDPTGAVRRIAEFDVDGLLDLASKIVGYDHASLEDAQAMVSYLKDYVATINEGLEQLDKIDAYIKEYEENRSSILARIASEKKKLADGKKKLAAEERKYKNQIKAGWTSYYAEKAKYEAKLEEAKLLLEENREEAEKKLAEAKAEVANMEPCRWITLDRKANAGYVDAYTNLEAIRSSGNVFGLLFMIVTAIVCLSTLVIIIDEQKGLVGTAKAFGFHKGEVLGKYLTFGVAAALVGSVLSAVVGYAMSSVVQPIFASTRMYQTPAAGTIITPGITVLAGLIITVVMIIASFAACSEILKSPASVLMKGGSTGNKKKKKTASSSGGSLYSRLIMRNMADDKARVIVTITIIAFSCMLIGMGISMKLAYDGMSEKQANEVYKYDFRLTMNDDVSDEESAKLASVIADNKAAYLPATTSNMLYRWDGRIDGLQLICADPAKIGDFYAIKDPKSGEDLTLPDDGVLIQKRMRESYNMQAGDSIPIIDSTLKENEAEIKGYFANYVGRTVAISPAAYKNIFGKENDINSYYVKLNGADESKLKEELLAVTDELSFSSKKDFKSRFESVSMFYNVVVVIITGTAILISFMILTNLANIFLMRRKTELSVMRVNGFSIKQAKGYLTKETIFTTTAGLVLGVIMGALLTPTVVRQTQQPDLEFISSFHPIAWVIAVVIEAVFAILINSVVFSKVKDLNLRDIAD